MKELLTVIPVLKKSPKLGDEWKTGFVGNYVNTKISKATGANDSSVAGAFASPISYDLKGNGFATPTDPLVNF